MPSSLLLVIILLGVPSGRAAAIQQTGTLTPSANWFEIQQQTQQHISEIAFDPASFFRQDQTSRLSYYEASRRDLITIRYFGDDEGWPVHSIAIREGCLDHRTRDRGCSSRRTARMVRAPAVANMGRPRTRGWELAKRVLQAGARTREAVAAEIATAAPDWLEADIATCPAAAALIGSAGRVTWVEESVHSPPPPVRWPGPPAPPPPPPPPPVMHADTVEVTFRTMNGRSTYVGIVDEDAPSGWAGRLAAALEPCWRAAPGLPPWKRADPKGKPKP